MINYLTKSSEQQKNLDSSLAQLHAMLDTSNITAIWRCEAQMWIPFHASQGLIKIYNNTKAFFPLKKQ